MAHAAPTALDAAIGIDCRNRQEKKPVRQKIGTCT